MKKEVIGLFDTSRRQLALYQRAERRVVRSARLAPHQEYILADWPEGDEHLRWLITAPVQEILTWVQAGQP